MDKGEALKVIAALRSGVPSRRISTLFTQGREGVLQVVRQGLQELQEGGHPQGVVMRGEYGEGKSHLLHQIANEARARNLVVSLAVLSRETPFDRLRRVLRQVAASTYTPGSFLPGIEVLLRGIRAGSPVAVDLLQYAEQHLHRKVYAVLRNYLRSDDSLERFLLASDLAGSFILLPRLRAIHRLNFAEALRLPKVTPDQEFDYFKLLGYLFRRLGYNGWVILFDELELIGRLSPSARARAYAYLGSFLNLDGRASLPHTQAIFSLASSFFIDVVQAKGELDAIPRRLEGRGETELAAKVAGVIRHLAEGSIGLDPLGEAVIREVIVKVEQLHGLAYGWNPPSRVEEVLACTAASRLRTRIRYAIESLDLEYLYGSRAGVRVGRLEEPDMGMDRG